MDVLPESFPITFSCYFTRYRIGEQFVPEHAIGYVVSGAFEVNDNNGPITYNAGGVYFCRRNQLAKFVKQPGETGEYRSVSIYFDQDTLRNFSLEYGYSAGKPLHTPAFITLTGHTVLRNYMESLRNYEDVLKKETSGNLLAIKQKEALILLLQAQPELKNVLFDFSEPGKIDLEAFMNRNFHFNVDLSRFAYLTGRSLSTFKRDFEKIFHTTPSRWLLQKRLQEAYYLIREKRRIASDIYLDLGFEDLSHFSFAFKKQYGVAPSMI